MISSPVPPNLRSLLDAFKQEVFFDLNCHMLGSIVAYDGAKQSASVQLSARIPLSSGGTQAYPVLTDCPVFALGAKDRFISMPILPGDPCLVLFSDRDIDNWFVTGGDSVPNTNRTHSLSDGMVLVGFRSLADPVPAYSANGIIIGCAGGAVSVHDDPEMSSVHGGVIQVGTKVLIRNTGGSLVSALDALCTALTSWVDTRGDTPNPATVAAINAAKAAIDDVLR